MSRKPPTGPHADVATRFSFLLDSLDLDREGFVAAVDGAVTARSLFAILSGDRRPSRSLAVLVERTFGFRADHLLHGQGAMWVTQRADGQEQGPHPGLTDSERRLVDFARRSVDNARLLDDELDRAEAWEAMWRRTLGLLRDLERLARDDDPGTYPEAATATLEECWRMADAFQSWTGAKDQRRVVHLTRLFVQRFLVQVPGELAGRGGLSRRQADEVRARATELLDHLAQDAGRLDEVIDRGRERLDALAASTSPGPPANLAAALHDLAARIDRLRPTPA